MNNKLMLPNDLYKSKAEKDAAARIITAGNVYFPEAKKRGITIYGSIAQYLEDNRENIDELSRKISYYMTNKKDLELLKKYEAESSLFEKFIKNNNLRGQGLEFERKTSKIKTVYTVEIAVKGAAYLVKKISSKIEKKHVYKSIWEICREYANLITMNARNDAKRRVNASLMNIHRELFGEKLYDLSDTAYSDKPLEKVYLPVDEEGRKSVVEILCSLYFRKHDQTGNASQKEDDLEYLRELCIALGLDGILETEFNNFNILYASNIYDSNRIPTAIYNIYHEIQTGLNIDTSYAREMETRFAEYVPNLDTQKAARTAGKGLGAAGFAVAGVITENPLLLQTSAAMAASAIDDMSGETKTKIGNCLKIAVGEELPENGIRKCLDEAVKYRKEINGD